MASRALIDMLRTHAEIVASAERSSRYLIDRSRAREARLCALFDLPVREG
jgi:hypothetical protein